MGRLVAHVLDVVTSTSSAASLSVGAAPTPLARARTYRPDIDGLRALAVLSVIFSHARVRGFSGGFLGVDIFFVISGYLIYRDLVGRQRRSSALGFYARRVRRTLPALYLVCAITLLGGLVFMMPADLDELARSTVAAVTLVSNIFYFTQAGYFASASAGRPLLHTWSLGVEAQFYALAPLLALTLRGLVPARRKVILLVLFCLSIALTIGIRHVSPDAAFYLLPARAFEFLVGCLLAEEVAPVIRARWAAEAVAGVSLAALGLSIGRFTGALPLPGLISLVPCLATAAIIHVGATRETWVGTALGLRGPAFIGLISYSLYLWHWPVVVAVRYTDLPMTPALVLAETALLFTVSALSWRFVETPFRDPHSIWRRRAPVLVPSAAALIACASLGILAAKDLPWRFPPDVASVASYYTYGAKRPFREGTCFITTRYSLSDFDRPECLRIVPGKRNVLLIGDSHAAHLWTGLVDTWPGVNFLQATASGCKPVVGTMGAPGCTALMREMLDDFVPRHHLDAVVISALWDTADIAPLEATIAALKPKVGKVVVFGPVPRWDQPAATLIARTMLHGALADLPSHLRGYIKPLDAEMRAAIAPIATYVSPWDAMCPEGRCRLFAGPGVPMQFDYHHLTKQGADQMMATIRAKGGALF